MKNKKSLPISQPKATYICQKRHKDNKINKNRKKLCKFKFFYYLCEKIKY